MAAARAEAAQRAARAAQRKAVQARLARAAALARAKARQRAAALARARAWRLPITHYTLTSGFGQRWGRLHAGNDFAAPIGSRLVAMSTGTVTFAGAQAGYGNKVEIRYWDGTVSCYGHMDRVTAHVGQKVAPRQPRRLLRQHRPLDRPAPAPGDPPGRPRPGRPRCRG